MSILRLAIPSPLRRHFDYLPPPGLTADEIAALRPGTRVRVPFGRREVTGYLLETRDTTDAPAGALKHAVEVLDEAPLPGAALLELCLWCAAYYHHPPGEVFSHLFPKHLRQGKPHQPGGIPALQLTTRGRGLPGDPLPRSPRQAQVVRLLRQHDPCPLDRLKSEGISGAVLRSLADKALVEQCLLAPGAQPATAREGLPLNPDQAAALQALRDSGRGFSCHLLEGVTGSGKTEVYLQLIADVLQRGEQVMVLIPEIGLTPQTLERFENRFDASIVVLHSGLGDAQRYRAWESARDGSAHIVIGTRSAVFTPLARPGLIVVDEEHDSSFKQQDGFRYSARDVAVKRAQLHDCPVVLGSATPSLESLYNAELGRYGHHRLTERATGASLPSAQVLDVRKKPLSAGLSEPLVQAMADRLDAGQQVLLFLNRRGYAPTLQCHDCGWVAQCRDCDARMTVHRRRGHLRCHHCGAARALPRDCEQCHSPQLVTAGVGTEQTEDFLRARFADWPIHRVDSDSMSGRNAMAALVEQINSGAPCILLGTQMLAKGHHFPGVGLVAILDADAMLFSADFRGEERMAQLLTQVSGRAGREGTPGEVIVQTHYPDHPALLAAASSSYAAQARDLLAQRRAAQLPPVGQLLLLRTDCSRADSGEDFLHELRRQVAPQLPPGVRMIGPLPSPMQRRAGKFRAQLLVTAASRRDAQAAASRLVSAAEALPAKGDLKWSIDVDPQDLF